jgi:hypothetical protein
MAQPRATTPNASRILPWIHVDHLQLKFICQSDIQGMLSLRRRLVPLSKINTARPARNCTGPTHPLLILYRPHLVSRI